MAESLNASRGVSPLTCALPASLHKLGSLIRNDLVRVLKVPGKKTSVLPDALRVYSGRLEDAGSFQPPTARCFVRRTTVLQAGTFLYPQQASGGRRFFP